jgi:glycosyltransferase involved in cell wall biosynthesis
MSRFAIELLRDDAKLNAMKDAAYKKARRFDIKNIIPRYEKLYSRFCRMGNC